MEIHVSRPKDKAGKCFAHDLMSSFDYRINCTHICFTGGGQSPNLLVEDTDEGPQMRICFRDALLVRSQQLRRGNLTVPQRVPLFFQRPEDHSPMVENRAVGILEAVDALDFAAARQCVLDTVGRQTPPVAHGPGPRGGQPANRRLLGDDLPALAAVLGRRAWRVARKSQRRSASLAG